VLLNYGNTEAFLLGLRSLLSAIGIQCHCDGSLSQIRAIWWLQEN